MAGPQIDTRCGDTSSFRGSETASDPLAKYRFDVVAVGIEIVAFEPGAARGRPRTNLPQRALGLRHASRLLPERAESEARHRANLAEREGFEPRCAFEYAGFRAPLAIETARTALSACLPASGSQGGVSCNPLISLEAPPGFEPGIRVLQTHALPLGYGASRRIGAQSATGAAGGGRWRRAALAST